MSVPTLIDLLFEKAGVGLCLIAPDSSIVRANSDWLRSTGFSEEQVVGENIVDLFPTTRDMALALHARARAGHRVEVPRHAQIVNGRETWWEGSIEPVSLDGGTGLLITAREVSPRVLESSVRAEERLRESEERFRILSQAMTQIVCVLGPDGAPEYVNPTWVEFSGLDLEATRRVGWEGFVLPDDLDRARTCRRSALKTLVPQEVELRYRAADGGYRWFLSRLVPVVEDGRVVRLIGAGVDIEHLKRTEAALQQGEERLRLLIAHTPAAVAMFDRDMRYLAVSRRYLADYRLGDQQLLGRSHYEVFREIPDHWKEIHRRCLAGAVARAEEEAFQRADGTTNWLRWEIVPWRDAAGNVGGIILFSEDIGERKRIEDSLRARDAQFEVLIEELHSGVALIDARGRFTLYNRLFLDLFGLSRDADIANVNSQDWSAWQVFDEQGRLLHVDEHPVRKAALTRLPVRGQLIAMRLPGRGDLRWLLVSAEPMLGRDGSLSQIVCTYNDITDRRRAEEALRTSEERWNAAIENLAEGAIIATEAEQVIYWNPAARAMHGFTSEQEGLGPLSETPQTFELWTPGGTRLLTLDEWPMRRIKRGETVRNLELRLRRPNQGWERIVWYSGAMVQTSSGERLIFLSVSDLTEQRRAEAALREADRRKDEFLGMLSHELRNPLAPIRNSTYILQHAQPGSEQARHAQVVIQRQTEHLTRLVDDLLDVTRIARGKIELRRDRVDLREVVSRAAEDFRLVLRDRSVRFEVLLSDEKLWAHADATRITQIVGNLLHNASKFTRHGDAVSLSVEADGSDAVIRVRDTGAGIEAALLPHLFDPFVQGERTLARTEGGLGLGLALVKGIAELHGGSVEARSAGKGKGAEFAVRLPRGAPDAATRAAPRMDRRKSGRRVLVVDDNEDAARTLADLLTMLGHSVEVAYDGPTAIAQVRMSPPDVVLCDIGLPGMSGYEVAQSLRASESELLQLIAVSGYAQPEDVKRAIDAGFDAHVAKPCDPEQIQRLLA